MNSDKEDKKFEQELSEKASANRMAHFGAFVNVANGAPPFISCKISGSYTTTTTKKKDEEGNAVTVDKTEIDDLAMGVYALPALVKAFEMFAGAADEHTRAAVLEIARKVDAISERLDKLEYTSKVASVDAGIFDKDDNNGGKPRNRRI